MPKLVIARRLFIYIRLIRRGLVILPVFLFAIPVARIAIPQSIIIPMFVALRAHRPALTIAVAVTTIGPQHAAGQTQGACKHDQQGRAAD